MLDLLVICKTELLLRIIFLSNEIIKKKTQARYIQVRSTIKGVRSIFSRLINYITLFQEDDDAVKFDEDGWIIH